MEVRRIHLYGRCLAAVYRAVRGTRGLDSPRVSDFYVRRLRTSWQNVVRLLDDWDNVVRPSRRSRPRIIAEAGRDERTTYPGSDDGRKVELDPVIGPPFYLGTGIDQRLHRCGIDLCTAPNTLAKTDNDYPVNAGLHRGKV